jgi:F-type H+-transporting ATPase subunit b
MAKTAAQVREMVEEARRDGEALKARLMEEAKTEIAADRDRLRREVDLAKDQALREIWQQSVQLAAMMSNKTVRRSLSADDHRQLLDESLADLQQAGGAFRRA